MRIKKYSILSFPLLCMTLFSQGYSYSKNIVIADSKTEIQTFNNITINSDTTSFKAEYLNVESSKFYVVSASTNYTQGVSSHFGLVNNSNYNEKLVYAIDEANRSSYSNATLYGSNKRGDLGRVRINKTIKVKEQNNLTIIRNDDLFYMFNGGELLQIRKLDVSPTKPGLTVSSGVITFSNISYCANEEYVKSLLSDMLVPYEGYTVGNYFANYGDVVIDKQNKSVTFLESYQNHVFADSKIAFEGRYSGDLEVTFTTKNIKPLPSASRGDDSKWPKFTLVLTYEDGHEDLICIGAGNKQDRIETCIFYDFTQWHNHNDFTGDTNIDNFLDLTKENEFTVLITDTGTYKAIRVYVNGNLCAIRRSTSYGNIQFGFKTEYVSGTVQNFIVKEVK